MNLRKIMSSQQKNTINKNHKWKKIIILLIFFSISIIIYNLTSWYSMQKNFQETNDAYVFGNYTQIMSQVSGSVNKVWSEDTDLVKKGDILISLDKTNAQQEFEKSQAELAISVRNINYMIINIKKYLAILNLRKALVEQSELYLKQQKLSDNSDIKNQKELIRKYNAFIVAKMKLNIVSEEYKSYRAITLNDNIEDQPIVKQKAAKLRSAWISLQRTDIRSPIDGYVSHRNVQLGSQISTKTPLLTIIPSTNLWVIANFKETQLVNLRIGQPVTMTTDMYGKNVKYHGKVVGIDMGTDSAFSLLPSENATGNWIKITQRLPVRIELDPKEIIKNPLRIGLSIKVKIDTTNKEGNVLANKIRTKAAYESDALAMNLDFINKLIISIIRANIK